MNITKHPCFDLPLKKLLEEKNRIIAFNRRISKPDYKFKDTIKPNYPKYLDELIKAKTENYQIELF